MKNAPRNSLWKRVLRKAYKKAFPARAHAAAMTEWAVMGGEREWDVLETLVDPSRGAIDVGANVGVYTSKLSRLTTKVWAIEPNPNLSNNLQSIGYRNVEVVSSAVSDQEVTVSLNFPIKGDGSRSEPCATLEEVDGGQSIPVKTVKLDRYADEDVGFVKIDIEGHELPALAGAAKLFERQRPILVIEVEDAPGKPQVQSVSDVMNSYGYRGYFLLPQKLLQLSELKPEHQSREMLNQKIPHREKLFVNNFIFLPEEIEVEARDRIVSALN